MRQCRRRLSHRAATERCTADPSLSDRPAICGPQRSEDSARCGCAHRPHFLDRGKRWRHRRRIVLQRLASRVRRAGREQRRERQACTPSSVSRRVHRLTLAVPALEKPIRDRSSRNRAGTCEDAGEPRWSHSGFEKDSIEFDEPIDFNQFLLSQSPMTDRRRLPTSSTPGPLGPTPGDPRVRGIEDDRSDASSVQRIGALCRGFPTEVCTSPDAPARRTEGSPDQRSRRAVARTSLCSE